jgi:hypothetical protein
MRAMVRKNITSPSVEAARGWEQEKKRRYRRGGNRRVGLASFLDDMKPVKEKDLSPKLKDLKWIRSKPWRSEFRDKFKPSIPGVDARSLFEREKKRLGKSSTEGPSFENGQRKGEGWFEDRRSPDPGSPDPGSPVPLWERDRAVSAESMAIVTAMENGSSSAEKPVVSKKRRIMIPALMVCESGEPEGEVLCLHPLNYVGIDTCSARRVSSEIGDFLFLDRSERARNSVSLSGVGEGGPEVLGRGPMLVSTRDKDGKQTFLLDPAGVFVASSEKQARLRIYGQQRMKEFGFYVVQDYASGNDYLNYRDMREIPLTTTSGILMVETIPWNLTESQMGKMNKLVDDVISRTIDHYCFQLEDERTVNDTLPCLAMNISKLSRVETNRIYHWRHAHRSPIGERYTEKCHTCEASKHNSTYKRNVEFLGTTVSTNVPYWRLYSDAYGGQRSMGCESYEGGIGGFVFVCPVSGMIKAKLYSTLEQYPAVLYQVLQEIDSEGYVTRDIYCDTAAVNLSLAVEEVAEMFKVKIVPISGGMPQELAYAESAVRTLGQMSRSLMLGAPHLPAFIWGMSDLYAAWIHRMQPQKLRGHKSPHEIVTGREPDDDVFFIRVFGCPCQYEPAYVVEHKRSAKTEWGWFVGVQWPMALILRPADNKVLSISRKKIYCHEIMYAKFDPETQTRPLIDFKDFSLDEAQVDEAIQSAITAEKEQKQTDGDEIPEHVLSVKLLSDSRRNQGLLSPQQRDIPEEMQKQYHETNGSGECDEFNVPDELKFKGDRLFEDIEKMKSHLGKERDTI